MSEESSSPLPPKRPHDDLGSGSGSGVGAGRGLGRAPGAPPPSALAETLKAIQT